MTKQEKLDAIRKIVNPVGAFEYHRIMFEIKRILDLDEREIPEPTTTEAQSAQEHSQKVTKWLVDAQSDQPPAEPTGLIASLCDIGLDLEGGDPEFASDGPKPQKDWPI